MKGAGETQKRSLNSKTISPSQIVEAIVAGSLLILFISSSALMTFPVNSVAAAGVISAGKPQQLQPNVNASNIYQTHKMVLSSNIRNLVIVIPNEAHEPPGLLPKDLRVANQLYIPQNVVVNVGTYCSVVQWRCWPFS
ncbi:MAG: hypothetical protein M3P08_13210 [Thermoproteota archaeon]|nr:hypothetical protein [Thermoproteota archaeon]